MTRTFGHEDAGLATKESLDVIVKNASIQSRQREGLSARYSMVARWYSLQLSRQIHPSLRPLVSFMRSRDRTQLETEFLLLN